MVNLMTFFSAVPLALLPHSILLKADSNLACHVLLDCCLWYEDFIETLTALLDNQIYIFLALHTC